MSAEKSAAERKNLLLWGSVFFFLICYIGTALAFAAHAPLWMDEVLTVWTIRLASVSRIYSALERGAQAAPPAFHVGLYYYAKIAGGGNLALRIPSLAAALLTGVCAFTVFRRQIGTAAAIFACGLLLEALRPYAVQVRPYTLVTCCFAAALVLWHDLPPRAIRWRCTGIGLLLALAISLHFYAVLFIPCLGLMEFTHALRNRRLRLPVWVAMTAAGASTFLWLPLINAVNRYNPRDINSPSYYAKPELGKLTAVYSGLLFPAMPGILIVLATLAMLAVSLLPRFSRAASDRTPWSADFRALVAATGLLPLITFAFSLTVTGTFHERYTLAAAIGLSALVAGTLSRSALLRRMVPAIVILGALSTVIKPLRYVGEFDQAAAFQQLPGPLPVVIAEGLQFFQLEESAPPAVRSRLVYLTLPPGMQAADPTNPHAVERWKVINPGLPVQQASEFLKSNLEFYVLDTRLSDDTPATWLLSRHLIELKSQTGGILLYRSSPARASGLRP